MSANIEIRGMDKLVSKMASLKPAVVNGIRAGTEHLKGKIATYPPASRANEPRTYRSGAGWDNMWYQRGWGSKWALANGDWHGNAKSEQLGQRWATRYENAGLTGIVGNNVSYARYVQGERSEQVKALKNIGWKSVEDVAEDEAETVINFIKALVDAELDK